MAQILKNEVRERIIESAKQEFLAYGFKDASMRRIAEKSNMTVGNLYRYFKSKDSINETIVSPTLQEINELVKDITSDGIDFTSTEFNVDYSVGELREKLITLSDKLSQIAYKRKIEFKILMMHSKLNDDITSWFASLIRYFIINTYHLKEHSREVEIMAGCYATSIIEGLKRCLTESKDEETFNQLSKIFMLSYVGMLENDIGKYIGK